MRRKDNKKETEGEGDGRRRRWNKKDGPGPVMVSETLCPAVHILGT